MALALLVSLFALGPAETPATPTPEPSAATPESSPPAPTPDPAPSVEVEDSPPDPTPSAAPPTPAPAPPPAPPSEALLSPAEAPAVAVTPTLGNLDRKEKAALDRSRYTLGKGYTLASHDERYSLQIRVRFQLRYDLEHPNADGKALQHSLQVRRMRLALAGNVFSKHVKYRFQFGFSPRDMQNDLPNEPGSIRRNPLRDARVEIDRLRDFTVAFGQFKVPFSRQRRLSSSAMNLVDRSTVNLEFNLDRDIGVEALSKDLGGLGGRLGYHVGVFMGEGRNAFDLTDFGLLYVGRLEIRPMGAFDDDSEGDLERSHKPGLGIGLAYAFQDRAHPARGVVGDLPADRGTTDFHHATIDALFKWRGVSLTTALHLRRGFNRKNGGALDDMGAPIATVAARQGLGWFAQLGYVVPKIPLEVVGRYGLIRDVFRTPTSLPDSDEAGGGLNWYFVGHDLKLQLDYFRLWDESLGATPAEAARNGLDRLRLQVQVYF